MEIVVMMAVTVALYYFSSQVLDRIEASRGEPFEHRTVVFFVIFLTSLMLAFYAINTLFAPAGPVPAAS